MIACVAGVNGKGDGERERGRKMGFWELGTRERVPSSLAPSPPSPPFLLPSPLPVYACYAGYEYDIRHDAQHLTFSPLVDQVV